ncbi:MAG: hypothetical protein INR71_11045, partial [Terriglobus roseus]|nr:hypothetical protein [Terriglobus roseus]
MQELHQNPTQVPDCAADPGAEEREKDRTAAHLAFPAFPFFAAPPSGLSSALRF